MQEVRKYPTEFLDIEIICVDFVLQGNVAGKTTWKIVVTYYRKKIYVFPLFLM